MSDNDLNVILFDYRGLKFTFRLMPPDQDANGDAIPDIRVGEDGTHYSVRFDELLQYGDIIADELARRAPRAAPPAPPAMPTPRPQGQPTGYVPPQQADQGCPRCGGALGSVKQTSRGRVRECLQQNGQCKNERGYPTTAWLDTQQGGRR